MSVFVRGPGEEGLEKRGWRRGPGEERLEKRAREQRVKNCFLAQAWMTMLCVAALVIAGVP